jgi:DnaK suppressor protein
MPAKKKASKKKTAPRKTKASAARKKASAKKKAPATKKTSAKKKTAARKSPAKKKPAAKKKAASKKKPAAVSKAAGRKKTAKKKPASKKKPAASKKAVARKKPASRKKGAAATKAVARKKPAAKAKRFGASGPLRGFDGYRQKRGEAYMSDAMLEHFRQILLAWKRELMEEVDRTVGHMKDEAANFPDPNDRATQESEFSLELRTRDRERKLLRKIDSALQRIDDGSYGYCAETGEEIGLKRLEARPVATLSVEAQERRELADKQFRDWDDR